MSFSHEMASIREALARSAVRVREEYGQGFGYEVPPQRSLVRSAPQRHLRLVEPDSDPIIEQVFESPLPAQPIDYDSPSNHESINLITPHPKRKILSGIGRQGPLQTGRSNITVTAQADFGEATLFTVQLDANLAGVSVGTVAYCLATVEWCVFGITLQRTVDVALGVSISGLAESVKVRLIDATPAQYPQGVTYTGTILIATNPRPTTAVPPVLTALYTTTIVNGASTTAVPVPSGGNAVAVFASPQAGGVWPTMRLRLQTATGVDLLKTVAAVGSPFVPLPTGTGQAVVDNFSGASADISILWGIDG